jgi:hypothetical protein
MPLKTNITNQDVLDVTRIAKEIYGPAQAEKLGLFGKRSFGKKGFEGPLPDVIGYSQHGGECANDTLQEILMFADTIREYTQPIVYGLTPEQFDLRSKLTLPFTSWKRYTDYFKFIQKRFHAHYDVLNVMRKKDIKGQKYRKDFDEVCLLDPIFRQKKTLSPETGILSLKRLKEELVYTQSGMLDSLIHDTYVTLLEWLGIPFMVRVGDAIKPEHNIVGIQITGSEAAVRSDKVFHNPKLGHSTGFLKMNGEWYHYDDNHGLMKAGQKVIDVLMQEKLAYVTYKKQRYFCKTRQSYNLDTLVSFPKVVAVWKDGAWDDDVSAVHDDDGTLRRGASIFLPRFRARMAIVAKDTTSYNNTKVQFGNGNAASLDEINTKMSEIKDAIYANQTSNSALFEDMYHYALDNFDYLKQSPEHLKMITISVNSVIGRVACTPMTHAWAYHLRAKLSDLHINFANWFEISNNLPGVVYQYGLVGSPHTPMTPMTPNAENLVEAEKLAELRKQDAEAKQRMNEEERKLIKAQKEKEKQKEPCPEGQIRDNKTRKCREKTEENIQEVEAKKEAAKQKREEKKALGHNKTKRAKKEPKKPKVYVF